MTDNHHLRERPDLTIRETTPEEPETKAYRAFIDPPKPVEGLTVRTDKSGNVTIVTELVAPKRLVVRDNGSGTVILVEE